MDEEEKKYELPDIGDFESLLQSLKVEQSNGFPVAEEEKKARPFSSFESNPSVTPKPITPIKDGAAIEALIDDVFVSTLPKTADGVDSEILIDDILVAVPTEEITVDMPSDVVATVQADTVQPQALPMQQIVQSAEEPLVSAETNASYFDDLSDAASDAASDEESLQDILAGIDNMMVNHLVDGMALENGTAKDTTTDEITSAAALSNEKSEKVTDYAWRSLLETSGYQTVKPGQGASAITPSVEEAVAFTPAKQRETPYEKDPSVKYSVGLKNAYDELLANENIIAPVDEQKIEKEPEKEPEPTEKAAALAAAEEKSDASEKKSEEAPKLKAEPEKAKAPEMPVEPEKKPELEPPIEPEKSSKPEKNSQSVLPPSDKKPTDLSPFAPDAKKLAVKGDSRPRNPSDMAEFLKRQIAFGYVNMLARPIVNTRTDKIFGHEFRMGIYDLENRYVDHAEVTQAAASDKELQIRYDKLGIERVLKLASNPNRPKYMLCMPVSVNYFWSWEFIRDLVGMIEDMQKLPEGVYFDFDEDVLLSNVKRTKIRFELLRRLGIKISIGKFGYRFFEYAKIPDFEIDLVKISEDLVRNFDRDYDAQSMVYDILAYANLKKIDTVALGIDTTHQKDVFTNLGCNKMQGSLESLRNRK